MASRSPDRAEPPPCGVEITKKHATPTLTERCTHGSEPPAAVTVLTRYYDGSGGCSVPPEMGTVSTGAQPPRVRPVRRGRQPRRAEGELHIHTACEEMMQTDGVADSYPQGRRTGRRATGVGPEVGHAEDVGHVGMCRGRRRAMLAPLTVDGLDLSGSGRP